MTFKKLLSISFLAFGIASFTSADAHKNKGKEKYVSVDSKITLEATEFKFKPNKLEIPVDTEVEIALMNAGVVSHNLLIVKDGEKTPNPKIPSVQKDEKGKMTIKFNETGNYTFYCDVPGHKQAGMTGKIRVISKAQK